jgi:hypothetical protein
MSHQESAILRGSRRVTIYIACALADTGQTDQGLEELEELEDHKGAMGGGDDAASPARRPSSDRRKSLLAAAGKLTQTQVRFEDLMWSEEQFREVKLQPPLQALWHYLAAYEVRVRACACVLVCVRDSVRRARDLSLPPLL